MGCEHVNTHFIVETSGCYLRLAQVVGWLSGYVSGSGFKTL